MLFLGLRFAARGLYRRSRPIPLLDQLGIIASSLLVAREDLQESPFATMGGLAKARRLFGERLGKLLDDLNRSLVA